jgi:hypothetical protein
MVEEGGGGLGTEMSPARRSVFMSPRTVLSLLQLKAGKMALFRWLTTHKVSETGKAY